MSTFTYERSLAKYNESRRYLALGVSSSLRASMKPTPLFAQSASGARVRDVDGNEYIDYLLAYGPLILGHAHPGLNNHVFAAMSDGVTYGLQHDGEIKLACRLTELLPCAELVSFSGSGTEAVMLALRLARAYTGKTKIVRFHGHYHGWSDTIFTSFPSSDMQPNSAAGKAGADQAAPGTGGQSEISLTEVILLPWNDPDALERTLAEQGDEIAAVISEPIMCNSGCIYPQAGYLERMRELTRQHGIVMILDEVITGFRIGIGGAHGKFGVQPDLVTIGKALGGGFAISAVAGSKSIMQLVENGTVSHLGTLNGNPVVAAAGEFILEELSRDGGAAYERMERIGNSLIAGIRERMGTAGIRGIVNGSGPVFHVMFTDEERVENFAAFNRRDAAKYAKFAELLLEAGVLVRSNGLWYVSAVHTEREVAETLEAVERTLARL
jgi:glutamate-1-semialdehyde 2,1-aminomutase